MNGKLKSYLVYISTIVGIVAIMTFLEKSPLSDVFIIIIPTAISAILTIAISVLSYIEAGNKKDSGTVVQPPVIMQVNSHDWVDGKQESLDNDLASLPHSSESMKTEIINPKEHDIEYGELIDVKSKEKYKLSGIKVSVGRSMECDCCLKDLTMSRRHALLQLRRDFQKRGPSLTIMDMNSANGTKVNGRSIPFREEVQLHNGDIITFGSINMAYHEYEWFKEAVRLIYSISEDN